MMKEKASTIICTMVAGNFRYVYNSWFGPDNKRKCILIDDPSKARLYFEDQAKDLITKLPADRKYFIETFQPALA